MRISRVLSAAALCFAAAVPSILEARQAQSSAVQERLDMAALAKIRDEGLNHSRVDSIAGYLMDVLGERLTGSDELRHAQQWAATTMRGWGLANVAVEPWDSLFGRGWERVSYEGRWLEPYVQPLYAMPLAWSGSTRAAPAQPARGRRGTPAADNGTVTCPVKVVEQDSTMFDRYNGQLQGACVLMVRIATDPRMPGINHTPVLDFNPVARRLDADSILALAARPFSAPERRGGNPDMAARMRAMRALNGRVGPWLRQQGVVAILQPSQWQFGLILGAGGPEQVAARDSANYEPLPALVVSAEQAGQMYRDLQRGVPVRLELDVQNRFTNADKREYNVVGEIPGTDLASQLVMVGAHYDSWYGGTGATDNGAGSVVMLEAMRILKTLGLPMRRTVRIALWSGEEQGLLGSRDYVRKHQAELRNISAYLNVDNGSGRLRGVYAQGNAAVIPIFDQLLAPFHDLGVVASVPENTGGTDHLSFDAAGVPGFQYVQDPLDYGTRTHHSQVDTYERLQMDDLRQAATVVAWTVYEIANRDDMMPRKPAAVGTN